MIMSIFERSDGSASETALEPLDDGSAGDTGLTLLAEPAAALLVKGLGVGPDVAFVKST